MNKLLTLISSFFLISILHAQVISDNQFAKAIRSQCKTCIDESNKLLKPAQELLRLNVNRSNIKSLAGIEGFKNLMTLDCSNNPIENLPFFTNLFIKKLRCHNCGFKMIPPLPSSITQLDVSYNKLETIFFLPDSLQELNCNNNKLTEIPQLPLTVTSLSVANNKFKKLPILTEEMTFFDCSHNLLEAVPRLTSTVQKVDMSHNLIKKMPALPFALREIYAASNKMTEISYLPDFLEVIDVHDNELEKLPFLPRRLKQLDCSKNRIVEITDLPQSLQFFECRGNYLNTLPHLPRTLTRLLCDTASIGCVPNHPEGMVTNGKILDCVRGNYGLIAEKANNFITTTDETQLIPYRKNNQWGFANARGELMIPAQYDDAGLFEKQDSCTYSYAFVTKDGKKGVVDVEGELIVQPDYDIVHPLQKSGFMVKTDAVSEWLFVSKDATIEEKFPNWVQTDTVFKTYADKTARIAGSSGDVKFLKVEIPQLLFDQNRVGYTMKRKTPISTPPYEMIETIDYIAPQYDSIKYLNPMSFDTLLAKKKGQWGIISTKNLTLVNQQYDDIKPQITHVKIDSIFKKGATYFGASRNGKWGVVSGLDTSVVVNFEYDDVEIYYLPLRKTVDSSAMRLFFKVKKDGKWGLIGEKTWELLVPIEFEKILVDKTKNGFRLLKDSQEGYFITAARKTLPPIYKEVHFFRNGFARVRTKDDKIGYVNENGLEYFD